MNLIFRKKYDYTSGSLSALAYRKFFRNRLAFSSFIFIVVLCIIAILGYLITPDPTPKCNRQILEIAVQDPGFHVEMLRLRKGEEVRHQGIMHRMLYGQVSDYQLLPAQNVWQEGDSVFAEVFTGDPGIKGEQKAFKRSLVVMPPVRYTFWLGTDQFGRDLLSRLMLGTRISLSVGFIAVFISLVIGVFIGSLGGFFRGWVDQVVMWLINVVWSIPTLLLVIAITFALGRGFWQVFIAVGLTMWVDVARVTRGQILAIREKEYVEAARALGFSNFRIILRHILPNIAGPIIVISAANFASAILMEAGLSFLGLGVQPPMPSWGSMIRENYAYIILQASHLAILPGIAIMLTVLAFMIIGNGLRDAFDVRTIETRRT
jgi:ABC-type dipeptide/oligopeptide/nickel transport system permease subunit